MYHSVPSEVSHVLLDRQKWILPQTNSTQRNVRQRVLFRNNRSKLQTGAIFASVVLGQTHLLSLFLLLLLALCVYKSTLVYSCQVFLNSVKLWAGTVVREEDRVCLEKYRTRLHSPEISRVMIGGGCRLSSLRTGLARIINCGYILLNGLGNTSRTKVKSRGELWEILTSVKIPRGVSL